jgi:polysaccharide pyruvyl transferase WcaK-like protein
VSAIKQYGFKADYKKIVFNFINMIIKNTDAKILLLPHVITLEDHFESDVKACLSVQREFAEISSNRITVLPAKYNQSEIKWIISKCSWFCGTRMHSTIAALSSGVPTAAIAYSDKTRGVFESCGQGDQVVDPRKETTDEIVDKLYLFYKNRMIARDKLSNTINAVINQAESQMTEILEVVSGCKNGNK